MEAFSDGVLAIIITIMVLSLRIPTGKTFQSLSVSGWGLLGYVLSFMFVGIYWANHHHLLKTVRHVTASVLWANLNLLFWISLFPFATAWMADTHFATDPVVIYGVISLLAGCAYTILQLAIIRSQGPSSELAAALGSDIKGKLSVAIFLAGTGIAFISRWAALGCYWTVAIIWLIPDRRLEPVIEKSSDAN